ncbi:MAG TPA: hypothetical protein VKM55_14150 [Candidatus Lokiarchaeia archaeon]|nr:hypothetical protein [Candidatus Lokiarchaeia archaeon]
MEGLESSREMDKVKHFLLEKEVARQSTISSSLKISPTRLNGIITSLENDGFLEKKKAVHNGHQINTVNLVKTNLDKGAYKGAVIEEVPDKIEKIPVSGVVIFDSPCFFCAKLETCADDGVVNYFNCPRLNEWISKPL